MVDLPTINNTVPEVRAPQSRVSPGQIASPYQELAANLDKAGEVINRDIAVPLAEREAPASVTLDKDGQPVVSERPIIVGEAAQAFARAARTTALNMAEPDILEKTTAIRLAHPGNPSAVKAAGAAYVSEIVAKQSDPLLKSALQIAGERAVGTNVRTSLVEADHINTRNFLSTSEARLTALNDKAVALARQPGGIDTPDYAQTVADRGAIYKELVGDPRAKYPPARAAQEIAEQGAMEKGQAVIGRVVEQYKTNKNAAGARKALMDWAWGPGAEKLPLSEQQRNHIVSQGVGALERVGAEDTVERTEFRSGLGKYVQGVMTAPDTFNDIAHNGYVKKALELGDAKSIGDLNALKTVQPLVAGIKRLPTDQQVIALKQLDQGIVPKIEGMQGELPLKPGSSIFDQTAPVMRLFESAAQGLRGHVAGQVEHMTTSMIKDLGENKAVTPQEISTFVSAVQSTGRNDLIPKLQLALSEFEGRRGLQIGESAASLSAQFGALARGGEDPVKRALHSSLAANVVKDAANLQKDPLTEMGARGWAPAPRPLPMDDAQGAAVELRTRDQALAVGRTLDKSLGPKSAILPGEVDGVTAALTQGDVKQAQGILGALDVISPEVRKETVRDLKDGLIGMSKSYDPARMSVGMSSLDREWRTDPVGFAKDFGADAVKRMQTWQTWKDSASATEIVERFKRADDPAFAAARKNLGEQADEELKKIKPADVAYQMGTSWGIPVLSWAVNPLTGATPAVPTDNVQAAVLKAEFDTVYTDLRENGVEAGEATKQAAKRMAVKWGPSPLNGNALMQNPPERYYPEVNSSHDWMRKPIEQDIEKALGKPRTTFRRAEAGLINTDENWSYSLLADSATQADVTAGRPPSYQVFITDKHSGRLEQPKDAAGNPMRYRWDAAPAIRAAREAFTNEREGRREMLPGFELGGTGKRSSLDEGRVVSDADERPAAGQQYAMMDKTRIPEGMRGGESAGGGGASRSGAEMNQHRAALTKDSAGLRAYAREKGLSDGFIKQLIDDQYASKAMAKRVFEDFLRGR